MVYLDYAATTPLDPAVLKKMLPYFSREFANPASIHTPGQRALKAVDDARYEIASIISAKATDIVFTSGATESNNLILSSIAAGKTAHIITTKVEHDSILEPLHALEKKGARVSYLDVDRRGLINPSDIEKALRPETVLVTIGYVNSETGVIQPIKKIGRLIKNYNERLLKQWLNTSTRKRGLRPKTVFFHTDATQAANFCDLSVRSLHLDAMSLSAHKIYGPKGIGLLYAADELKLVPLLRGGHQERNLRSGTLNVPAIVGFVEALGLAKRVEKRTSAMIKKLRGKLMQGINKACPEAIINTPLDSASPSHVNITFPGIEGDIMQAALDEQGIAVSTGSACASGNVSASHVLLAMGRGEEAARSSLRFTVGRQTSAKDIERALKTISGVYKRLRKAI